MGNIERYFCINAILGIPEKPLITLIRLHLSDGVPIELFAERLPNRLRLLPFVKSHAIEKSFVLEELMLFAEHNNGKILRLRPYGEYPDFTEDNRAIIEKNYIIVR